MRSALEEKIGTKIILQSAITPCLIRHAGYSITRCRIRPNGRTGLQMLKGRTSNGKLADSCEFVHFLIPKPRICKESSKTDGARVFGWDVMFDQASTSLERTVVYSECRRSHQRHRTPAVAIKGDEHRWNSRATCARAELQHIACIHEELWSDSSSTRRVCTTEC